MNDILVSISCTTYNHEKYIEDALKSFLMQKTNFEFEILIHDDASNDNTGEIIRQYQKKYPKIIKPILQKENQLSKGVKRLYYTFNHTRAKGKYIALCEGDDYWTDPYKLQKQVDYMEKHPECSMCFHAAEIVTENGERTNNVIRLYTESRKLPQDKMFYGAGKTNATASIMYKKELMDDPPSWYFDAPVGDTPLALILSSIGQVYYIDRFMSAYRVGVAVSWNNRIHNNNEKMIPVLKGIIKMLEEFNEFSNWKFDKDVKRKQLEIEVRLLKLERQLKPILLISHPKYKMYLKNFPITTRIKKVLNELFPKGHQFAFNMKKYFRD